MRASSRASQDCYVPARLAKQSMVMMMTGMMTAVMMMVMVKMTIRKLSITRLCKRLKHGRVRPKNSG